MAQKRWLTEDKLALILGLFLFLLGMLNFAGVDALGWSVKTNVWTSLDKILSPASGTYKNMSGVVSLLLTYAFITLVLSVGLRFLGGDLPKFIKSFTVVFFISFGCWVLGSYAPIAATPDIVAKFHLKWSLGLTGEAGFIVALVAGIIVGNFMPGVAEELKEALRPEMYIKIAIVMLGAELGVKAVDALSLASSVIFRGLCAIVEAYLIYWALVYFVARKYFKFSKEWAAPLASGISICGVSAAIATGGAIRARPVVPIMVSSLVVIFAVIELIVLPFMAQNMLWKEPLVAGAWMGLAVKTDGAAVASGAVADSLIRAKALAMEGVNYKEGWLTMTATTVKLFIDIFIGVWSFILAYIWCAKIECKPGEKVGAGEIWKRFPKFVIGYVITFFIFLVICLPATKVVQPAEHEISTLKEEVAKAEKQLAAASDPAMQADLSARMTAAKDKMKTLGEGIKAEKATLNSARIATNGSNSFRVMFFVLTFFTIGVVSNFKKLWEEGIGKLAAVYVLCLFGFIIWIGLAISWIFFHGVKPPIIAG